MPAEDNNNKNEKKKVGHKSMSEEEIAGLKEMFKMIDTDNSGQITLEELKNGLERVGSVLKDSEITWLMEAVSASLVSNWLFYVQLFLVLKDF